ncbi:MAG: cytochrome c biogenesis CcdA family protein [Oscillospiraceae bacterium]|nr:cytochrome c biogenesis CcdA family protein [Oscillospiraceae bacterium]
MQYVITFLEGLISFISPCMLPLLPVYLSYFAGGEEKKQANLARSAMFVLGFTAMFCLLGVAAGTVGSFFVRQRRWVELVCGALVIVFGLAYLEVIPLPFFRGMSSGKSVTGLFSAFVFGLVYAVSLTPCVGAFLGSALMLASSSGTALQGLLLLLCYSLGLGVPFLISAALLEQLKGLFSAIKKHYRVINLVCGVFLIAVGVCMACGWLGRLMSVVR